MTRCGYKYRVITDVCRDCYVTTAATVKKTCAWQPCHLKPQLPLSRPLGVYRRCPCPPEVPMLEVCRADLALVQLHVQGMMIMMPTTVHIGPRPDPKSRPLRANPLELVLQHQPHGEPSPRHDALMTMTLVQNREAPIACLMTLLPLRLPGLRFSTE
jgi:hypothetical protein